MMNWSEIPPNHFWQQSLLTRKPESTGSSWKALTVRVWTLWKLEKEGRFAFSLRSSTRTRSVSYKDDCQAMFQPMANKQTWEHFVSSDGGELQGGEAGSLKPYEKYLAEFGWALCLNDAEDLFSLARLGTPKAGLTTQLFVLHAGLPILVGQNCADNGYVHEYCSRTCFEGCEIWEPSTLPPMCVWSFWRNSLLRRLMWKRTSERRLRTLVIAVHWHFTSSGMSMYKEGSTDNFHDSSVFEKVDISSIEKQMSHVFFWQITFFFFFFFFFFEIEILIRIALFWWSGFSPLIFSTKRRRVSRVMLEGRNGQTRGRQIRRRGKQRDLRYNFHQKR